MQQLLEEDLQISPRVVICSNAAHILSRLKSIEQHNASSTELKAENKRINHILANSLKRGDKECST